MAETDETSYDQLTRLRDKQRNRWNRYRARFRIVFGVDLATYWHILTGFDVIKFDEGLIKSGSRSMEAAVRKKYGDAGVEIIHGLIGRREAKEEPCSSK